MRHRPNLSQIEAFVSVAEHLSFRKAAQKLHMSQPALSRCIQGAEDQVGAKLFDRNTRNVSLTSAGAAFFPIAQRLLVDFQRSLEDVAQFLDGSRGSIAIAALPSISSAFLPTVVSQFARDWPQVSLRITCPHHKMVEQLVISGEVDFGITMPPSKLERLDWKLLLNDEFVLVCGPEHPLASCKTAVWKVFENHPFIELSPTTSMFMLTQSMFKQLHIEVKPTYQIGGMLLMAKLIADGHGITAVPRLALPLFGDNKLCVIPLRAPVLTRSLGVLTRQGRSLSVVARNFLNILYESEGLIQRQIQGQDSEGFQT